MGFGGRDGVWGTWYGRIMVKIGRKQSNEWMGCGGRGRVRNRGLRGDW